MAAPSVSFVGAANVATSAGWSVTVSGISFGGQDMCLSARLGVSSCGTAAWLSTTSVECMASGGQGGGHDGFVTVSGIVGTRTKMFSYDGGERLGPRFVFAQLLDGRWAVRAPVGAESGGARQ